MRVVAEAGSIGIVFDEGEEEDTVIIDSIKNGTPASGGTARTRGDAAYKMPRSDCGPPILMR